MGLWATSCPQGCHRRSHLRSLCTQQAPGSQCLHLWGTSLPTRLHSRSHSRPRQPTRRSREGAPLQAATLGNTSMAPADPRYMPDVDRETALARSWGGIHCRTGRRLHVSATVRVGSMGQAMAPSALRWGGALMGGGHGSCNSLSKRTCQYFVPRHSSAAFCLQGGPHLKSRTHQNW